MVRKLSRTDLLFIISLVVGCAALSIYLFTYPYMYDESFYAVVPFRLANGDSLIQHEWHLTQFSSLFTYLPVKLWLLLKGSAEGIIVFLRSLYFIIHIAVTAVIYNFFRKHGYWSIVAAMVFFTQVPYRLFAVSYNSAFVIFTLLFTLSLLSVYKNKSKGFYVLAGVCFAGACVCNPIYCVAFALYLIACILWTTRASFRTLVIKIKTFFITKTKKNIDKNKTDCVNEIDAFPNMESYTCFFCKEAVIYSLLGIFIVAVIAVAFFFGTGGTINSIFENIENLLNSSEYLVTSNSLIRKIESTLHFFSRISFDKPYILPLFFLILLLDFGRKGFFRRCIYLSVSLVISIAYMFGIFDIFSFYTNFFSLPLIIFSATCYMLTENKNKKLFWCMWMPSLVAAVFQYLASNTLLTPLGIVLVIGNIAGVVFVKDLFNEIKVKPKSKAKTQRQLSQPKEIVVFTKFILCAGLCAQLVFNGYALQYEQIPYNTETVKASSGPYSGIIMTQKQYQSYENVISDFDRINSLNTEKEPVLITSSANWIYLYNESPMAVHSAWSAETINKDTLISYYKANPDKVPKYIYIDYFGYDNDYDAKQQQSNLEAMSEMFEFTKEEMSHGSLLTVESCKF